MPNFALNLMKLHRAGSVSDLTKHYRRLCKLYHPDLKSSDDRSSYESYMAQINEAYTEALKKFNILTFQNPKMRNGPSVHVELIDDPPGQPGQKQQDTRQSWRGVKPDAAFVSSEAARCLGKAMATLKQTRTFFSLAGCADDKEREKYKSALKELEVVYRKFSKHQEGQDALYYTAISLCKIKDYQGAIRAFAYYKARYPADSRNGLINFYSAICFHHLTEYMHATREYKEFLGSDRKGASKFVTLLAKSYLEASQKQEIPAGLPYG